MENFGGIDHGTTAIRCAILGDCPQQWAIRRDTPVSIKELVAQRVPLPTIRLIALNYSMGDGLSKITPIARVENRGIRSSAGMGTWKGVGTAVYDELQSMPAIVVPGLHRASPWLDPRFRSLYSHCGSGEKIGASYHALHHLGFQDFVLSDVSSNTVSILVNKGRIVGGIDACLGALGELQGPLDLQALRSIDSGKLTAGEAFTRGGLRFKRSPASSHSHSSDREALAMAVVMEIAGLAAIAPPQAVVLTGSTGCQQDFLAIIKRYLHYPLYQLGEFSAAMGMAEIARDVYNGKGEIMGVPVSD